MGMWSLERTLNLRHLQRHAVRTGLVLAGIALGVAAWTATRALERSLETALRSAATPLAGIADLYVSNGDAGVRRDLASRLASVPGVRRVRPVLVQRVLLPGFENRPAVLLGVDLAEAAQKVVAARQTHAEVSGVRVSDFSPQAYLRAAFTGQPAVLVGRELATIVSSGSGTASLEVRAGGTLQRFTRVGVVEAEGPIAALGGNVLLVDDRVAATLLGQPGRVSRLDLGLDPEADPERVRGAIEALLAGQAAVSTPDAQDRRILEVLAGLRVGFSLCGAGALALALFLVSNVLSMSLAQRQREIGILRCLGASGGLIRSLYLREAAGMGLVGAVLGLPLGWGLAAFSLGPLGRAMSDVFLPLAAQRPEFSAATAVEGIAAGMITVLLAALAPTVRASAAAPVEALRRTAAARPASAARLLAIGLVLTSLGLVVPHAASGLPPRFGTYGALILVLAGVLVVLPLGATLLARLLRPAAERLSGVAGRLAADQLARNPGRTGLTVAALAAAVALVFQTGGVIHGNEEAIRAWVDQGITGDLFVTAGGPLSASGQILPMPETLGQSLRDEMPGMEVVPMRFRYLNWERDGRGERLLLKALDARAFIEANAPRQPPLAELAAFRRLIDPGTVVVSENFAVLHGIATGDTIHLPGAEGPVPLRVIGTIADFSCSRGTVLVDRARFRPTFGVEQVDVFSLYLPPGASPEAVRRRLRRAPWAADHAVWVLTRSEIRTHILGMVGRFYGVAYVQEAVAAVVAALGVVTTLAISVLQRRRELGLLRAVGATQGQVLATILSEAVLMSVIAVVLGALLGMALQWYVLRVLLYTETGFVFPARIPWAIAVTLAAAVPMVGLLAGLGPGLHAARLRIVKAIAYE